MQMLTYKEWDAKEVAENLTFENRKNVAKNLSEDDYFDIAQIDSISSLAIAECRANARIKHAMTRTGLRDAKKYLEFCQTVHFFAAERLYLNGDENYAERLAYMLAFGVGCDVDAHRAAELYAVAIKRRLLRLTDDARFFLDGKLREATANNIKKLIDDTILESGTEAVDDFVSKLALAEWKSKEVYRKALKLLSDEGEICASLIQRKLSMGYAQARVIMDRMISKGIIREKGYKGIPIVDVSKLIEEVTDEI